jgi:diadenylate cyclase
MFESITCRLPECRQEILRAVMELAIEIAREGREGHKIGTLFTFGDSEAVLEHSRPLILDPLALHPRELRNVTDPNLRGTIKELAQLDGAFVIDYDGVFVAACRYLEAVATGLSMPMGLGTRHWAAAAISRVTRAAGIVVSESNVVRLYQNGELTAEIIPELWLMSRYNTQFAGPIRTEHIQDMAVLTPEN